ncbi:MAG: PepSY domain-containing protein [Methylomicrobium sp.]|nr:PepSY domain-containing protein [Methylomicrobium sp.]
MANLIKVILVAFMFLASVLSGSEIALAAVSLDEATRQVLSDPQNKVLGAKTEIINEREVHIIKVLTADGRIQHFIVDAETGNLLEDFLPDEDKE